ARRDHGHIVSAPHQRRRDVQRISLRAATCCIAVQDHQSNLHCRQRTAGADLIHHGEQEEHREKGQMNSSFVLTVFPLVNNGLNPSPAPPPAGNACGKSECPRAAPPAPAASRGSATRTRRSIPSIPSLPPSARSTEWCARARDIRSSPESLPA